MTFPDNLALAVPEIVLALGSLGLLVVGAFAPKQTRLVGGGAVLVLLAAAVAAATQPFGEAFGGGLISDAAATFAKVAIYLASAVAIPLGLPWFERRGVRVFEFPVLVLLAALGMGMMASSGDLISLYVGVELSSLSLYVLAAMHRESPKASEAGLKYFVLGALSSGMLLYGASLVYGFSGSTLYSEIAAAAGSGADTGLLFGLVFLICGLAFKVSAAPFHMWTPDVYEGAPTPVVAFFAAAPKLAAMVLFARVLADGFAGAADQWQQVLVVLALISVAAGAFGGLVQKNLKRLWAYSSIANVGYAVLGLSSGTSDGVQAMLMFMILHMIDVTGFFACLAALSRAGRTFALSALGLPPFSGFWAKVFVFKAAIDAGLWVAAVIGLVGSVVAAFYYLRLIKVMWFDSSPGATDKPPVEARAIAAVTAIFAFPVVLVALAWLTPLAQRAALSLGLA